MRHSRLFVLVMAMCVLAMSACSDSEEDKPPSTPIMVEIIEEGGEVQASQDEVEAERGQEIELLVSSDAVDEFHVHSEPEQEFAIEEGDVQTFTFSLDTAGEYEMESHELGVTILKLQIG